METILSIHHRPKLTRRETFRRIAAFGGFAGLPAVGADERRFAKGSVIRTVLKDVPPMALARGATLFHEHLSLAPDFMPRWITYSRGGTSAAPPAPSMTTGNTAKPFFMEDLDLIVEEMKIAAQEGVSCIVDGGHPDMGRNLDFLKRVSAKSGLPIVAGCGFYAEPFYPPEIRSWSEEQIAQELIRQANTQPIGVFGEIGSWDEITDIERKVFRSVAKAHGETRLPIFTHTGIPGKSAIEQLDLLERGGVKPEHVVIGHLGNLVDPGVGVHKEIAKRGAFLGFDRQGGPGDARQIPMVLALIEAGYAANLLFSSDLSSANQIKHNGGAGYAKTITVWGKKLREAGVDDQTLHRILVENPLRFLSFVPQKHRKA